MLSVDDARARVLATVRKLPAERVFLEKALSRVLAEDVVASRDLPAAAVSTMDGYALSARDVAQASRERPVRLRVGARSEAGHAPTGAVGAGECARIFTGAAVPAGCDAVVPQEETQLDGDFVLFSAPCGPGACVRPRGAEFARGERVLAAGTRLGPAHLGLLAALGRAQVAVYARPRVAVLATGDELRPIDAEARDGIVDSNSYAIAALVEAAGGVAVRLGMAPDDAAAIAAALEGAASFDVILTTAGVSVGERDHVREALGALGVELSFWRVAMKPGKPLAFGLLGARPVFALPGNPTSAMVSFEHFVRPALLAMEGRSDLLRPRATARLEASIRKAPGLTAFVRAQARFENGMLVARPTRRQDSGLLTSMTEANAFVVLGPESAGAEAGDSVAVELLDAFV